MMGELLTMTLPIAGITVGQRIGFYNEAHALRLGESMATEGQHDPIRVKRNGNAAKQPWTLVAGLHRLRGAEVVGWSEISAIQVADDKATEAQLRRLELAENLEHRHRRPIERAIMMVAQARLEEEIDHPGRVGESRQARGGRIKNSAAVTAAEAPDWRDRTASAFNCSLSTLDRHERIHRTIVEAIPDLAQRLNDHPMGESFSNIRKLAEIKRDDARRKVVETLLSKDDWKSMDEVMVASGLRLSTGNRAAPHVATELKFRDLWTQMSSPQRQSHFVALARDIPPSLVRETIEALKELLP